MGYDFRRASARWRSRLVTEPEENDEFARRLEASGLAHGLAVLHTCNRNEWVASSATPLWAGEVLRAQLLRRLRESATGERTPEPYVFGGRKAVLHMLRVSAGLESFVTGERQIAGQLNAAFDAARRRKRSSAVLKRLAAECARAAREAARLRLGDVRLRGVHDAAVRYLSRRYEPAASCRALVFGYGAIGRRLVQSLRATTRWTVTVCNRSRPAQIREPLEPASRLAELLAETDVLVVCTGAPAYTVTLEHTEEIERESNLIIVDLGIPEQVDPACGRSANVTLANLDTLEASGVVATPNPNNVAKLENTLAEIAEGFERFCRERDLIPLLHATRTQHERYANHVIPNLLAEEFPHLDDGDRRRLEQRFRGLIRKYTNTIFESIHQANASEGNDDGD